MVRNAFAGEHLFAYFPHIAKQNNFWIGLVLGQSVAGKDYIIHFAKTPPSNPHEEASHNKRLASISDVSEDAVVDHALQTTRILPGGMHVLGVFLVSNEDMTNPVSPKIKSLFNKMHRCLGTEYLFGNNSSNEKLLVSYCIRDQQVRCKGVEVGNGSVKPVELKFLSTGNKWVQIQCKYKVDQVYHICDNENDWPLKKHMEIILGKLHENLKKATFLFDWEVKDPDDSVDGLGKKKISKQKARAQDEPQKPIQVCILQPCDEKGPPIVSDTWNELKIFGFVDSKIWLNPKVSFGEAREALKEDILRSFSTRLEMHWDSLTEEEHAEDINSVHEPPRRVLISLPNSDVAISDYLFPGEGPGDVKASLEELLDFKIQDNSEVKDVEGQADLSDYYNETVEPEIQEEVIKLTGDNNLTLYYIGIGVALLVLIISLVIHFLQS